jgi:alanine-glyoxylate transaminase/serine-glyoxylate transaminase/serine-pyruvate transaminase
VPVDVDAWGIDAIYSGTQKCLSAPPGLSPVTLSARAAEALGRRTTPVQSWYFDLTMLQRYLGQERFYHHTAPISMVFALYEALRIVFEEGLEARFERHRRHAAAMKAGVEAIGLKYATVEGHRLPMLHCLRIPDGVEDLPVRRRLLEEFSIEVGGGLGEFKGKVWRVGLMGVGSSAENVLKVLEALEDCLVKVGLRFPPNAGVDAAEAVLGSAATA